MTTALEADRMRPGAPISRWLYPLAAPLIALAAALSITSIALLLSGHNPIEAYRVMVKYAFRTDSLVSIVNRAVPYFLGGLAVAIGFRMRLFNIGVDGQYRLAAVVAAAAGAALDLPAGLHVLVVLVLAMSVGMAWAAVPAVLKVTRGVNEVISTIMMNFVATGLAAFLLQNHFRVKGEPVSKTKLIASSGRIGSLDPVLGWFGVKLPAGIHLQGFVIIAVVLGIAFHVLVTRTTFGYALRASGTNPTAAVVGGIAPRAMTIKVMLISGAIAGLVGMAPLLSEYYRYAEAGFPTQLAFTGIAVALLGRNNPIGIAVGSLVFAFIERGSVALDNLSIPSEISKIMQGSMILAGVIGYEVVRRRSVAAAARTAAASVPMSTETGPTGVRTADAR